MGDIYVFCTSFSAEDSVCCTPRKQSGRDGEAISHSARRARQTPGHLNCSDLGRAQNTGPTKSAPLRTTRVPETERLGPGKGI